MKTNYKTILYNNQNPYNHFDLTNTRKNNKIQTWKLKCTGQQFYVLNIKEK